MDSMRFYVKSYYKTNRTQIKIAYLKKPWYIILAMKKDIHPQYFPKAKVSCACGNSFLVGATQESIEVEVCSACHPFYTGKEKIMDKVGQVQKFRSRLAKKKA
jgi:large subunit ribosomal protein L31